MLKDIFSSYATNENDQLSGSLPFVAAASLWYRCGMKLSCLRSLMESKPGAQSTNSQVHFDDFVALVVRVIEDEEESSSARGSFELSGRSDICKVRFTHCFAKKCLLIANDVTDKVASGWRQS